LMDACAVNATLVQYLSALSNLQSFNDKELTAQALLAPASLCILGTALLLAPILFGEHWLSQMLALCGLIVGAGGTTFFMTSFPILLNVLSNSEHRCLASVGLTLVGGLVAASFVRQSLKLGYFALGALGAGFTSWFVLSTADVVDHELAALGTAATALLCGLYFVTIADALVDTALGMLGAGLLAQGAVSLAVENEGTLGIALAPQYSALAVLAAATVLFLFRQRMLARRSYPGQRRVVKPGLEDGLIRT